MTTVAAPVDVPATLLKNALAQLDEAQTGRFGAAGTGSPTSLKEEEAYSSCSYTINTSTDPANHRNNRWNNIFSFDHSLLPGPYLNASLIPPYPCDATNCPPRRSYIASQAPLPHTLPTFYSNIISNKVSLIVNLSPFTEHGRVKADQYWPLEKDQVWDRTPGYRISHQQEPMSVGEQWGATYYQLSLSNTEDKSQEDYDIALLHITSWPDWGVFTSSDAFSKLLTLIDESAKGEGPVWIHCSAGIGRSGTVIAALLARDLGSLLSSTMQLNPLSTPSLTREAALTVAKKMVDHERHYRPHMVQTPEQLGMVVSAIGALLQQQQQQH